MDTRNQGGYKPENKNEDENAMHERHRQERTNLRGEHAKQVADLLSRHGVEHMKLEQKHEHERKGGNRRSADEILGS